MPAFDRRCADHRCTEEDAGEQAIHMRKSCERR
jgi:hypothetical protein